MWQFSVNSTVWGNLLFATPLTPTLEFEPILSRPKAAGPDFNSYPKCGASRRNGSAWTTPKADGKCFAPGNRLTLIHLIRLPDFFGNPSRKIHKFAVASANYDATTHFDPLAEHALGIKAVALHNRIKKMSAAAMLKRLVAR